MRRRPEPGREGRERVVVRNTREEDVPSIAALSGEIYGTPWREQELRSHLEVFPEGQVVAADAATGELLGMAASLILRWDDYDVRGNWAEFTDRGTFRNHDPGGRTLYGAEVMVRPGARGRGVGSRLYRARRELIRRLGLLRIRAGARISGYHRHADHMSPAEYVVRVIRGELRDPTLSFQLKEGFHVLGLVSGYLRHDPQSLGYAAIIEWLNPEVAGPDDFEAQRRFLEQRPIA
jgi:ribosomal protein S18 acetylase RimI-like enzyme